MCVPTLTHIEQHCKQNHVEGSTTLSVQGGRQGHLKQTVTVGGKCVRSLGQKICQVRLTAAPLLPVSFPGFTSAC